MTSEFSALQPFDRDNRDLEAQAGEAYNRTLLMPSVVFLQLPP